MLRIVGRNSSSNVMKVLWICSELDIPFEQQDLGGKFGGNDSEEYRSLNPNGLVPTIIENDGFVLWESNSIVRYLANKFDNGILYPADYRERASAERWMDWQSTRVSPAMVPVFRGMVRTPPEKRDLDAIESARQSLSKAMAILDRVLAENRFVVGENFTVGDVPLGIAAWRWFNMPIEREEYADLERWFAELCERPAYQHHIMKPVE